MLEIVGENNMESVSVVSEVCRPCDEQCVSCVGEGSTTATCQCRHVSRGTQCTDSCDTQNGNEY